ncbi:MAG: lantibiotic dehydratase [Ginsengibacter sp.]
MEELITDFGRALARTPLYSARQLFAADGSTHNLEFLVRDRLNDPVFLEAIYWSSPQLFQRVQKLKEGKLSKEKEQNLLHTLKKYLVRAHSRSTPYGILAGTGIVSIHEESEGEDKAERVVRVDSGLLQNILHRIETDAEIYPHLKYSINDTLYRIPGQFRFTEKLNEENKTLYQLSSLEVTPLLEKIGDVMADNKYSAREIFELSDVDAPFEVFLGFMDELIKSQFLVSELREGPTIKDEIKSYLDILNRIEEEGNANARKYITLLTTLQTTAGNFLRLPLGTLPLDEFKSIKEQLESCKVEGSDGHLFHSDLKKKPGKDFVLTSEQVNLVKKGVVVLSKLSANKEKDSDHLAAFKTLFEKKYGSREIPISEALDPEYGIAFPPGESIGCTLFNSLIEKVLQTNEKERKNPSLKSELTYFSDVEELNITDDDLPKEDGLDSLPSYFSVMGHLLPSGQILMEGVGKAHANSLPGRFAGLEKGTMQLCKEIAADEQTKNEEIIFAEIVFQPGGRTGNIAQRPSFFEYEIPYLAPGGVEKEKQLPVSDLLLSVRNNELVVRSSRLNKRVVPRLSNAHNFSISSLPVYQFLSFLQYPDERSLEINWGKGFKRRRLPRVTYGNLILHRARWFLFREDILDITSAADPVSALTRFLLKWKVTRFVSLGDGDNELFIDTANRGYLEVLLKEMEKREVMKLVEWPFAIKQNEQFSIGKEIQQFILPLVKKNGKKYFPFSINTKKKKVREVFEPGSEWVYFKIYCSAGFADTILMEAVKPTIDHLLKENLISKAFFIRYTDPHYHIRFRVQLRENDQQEVFAKTVNHFYNKVQPFLNSGIVWDLNLDTYRREVERYGEESMEESEEVFFHDSRLFLKCLAHEVFAGNDETRFLSAIRNLNSWLSVFRLTTEEKADFCETVGEGFVKEFGREIKYNIDIKYRELSNVLPTLMDSFIFDRELAEREANLEKLHLPKKNLASYIHMSMNRWFVTEQRLLEYMCYVFAGKYYKQLLHYHLQKN